MVNIQRILEKTASVYGISLDDAWFEPEMDTDTALAKATEPPSAEPVQKPAAERWDYVGQQCEIEGAPV